MMMFQAVKHQAFLMMLLILPRKHQFLAFRHHVMYTQKQHHCWIFILDVAPCRLGFVWVLRCPTLNQILYVSCIQFVRYLDIYQVPVKIFSTGNANICNLVQRWAVDMNAYACESLNYIFLKHNDRSSAFPLRQEREFIYKSCRDPRAGQGGKEVKKLYSRLGRLLSPRMSHLVLKDVLFRCVGNNVDDKVLKVGIRGNNHKSDWDQMVKSSNWCWTGSMTCQPRLLFLPAA